MRFLILFLILAAQGWGATYYVKPGAASPATRIQYSADATSCSTGTWTDNARVNDAMALIGEGGTLYLCAGTYNATMTNGKISYLANDQTIQGIGTVEIAWNDYGDFTLASTGFTGTVLRNVKVTGTPVGKNAFNFGTGSATIDGCTFDNNDLPISGGAGTLTVQRSTISNSSNASFVVNAPKTAGGTLNLYYNRLIDNGGSVRPSAAGTVNAYNNDFVGTVNTAIQSYAGATINLKNNRFLGNGSPGSGMSLIINVAGGTINGDSNLVLPSATNFAASAYAGTVTASGDVTRSPRIISPTKEGIVAIIIDDYIDAFTAVADYAAPKGVFITMAVSPLGDVGIDYDVLGERINAGHDVAVHGLTHSSLTNTHAIDFAVTATNPHLDIAIDQTSDSSAAWSGTVTIGDDWGADTVINITDVTRLDTVVNAIKARTGWEGTAINAVANILQKAKCLADVTNQTAFPYTAEVDQHEYLYVEVAEAKAYIESQIGGGFVIKALVPPGNATDATVQAWVADDSHFTPAGTTAPIIARGKANYAADSGDLSNFYAYAFRTYQVQQLLGTAELARGADALAEWVSHEGQLTTMYQHRLEDYSLANWSAIIDALSENKSVKVLTLRKIAERIADSGLWATADGITYTRTFTDASDFHLLPSSPAINAGVDVGLTTDIEGKAIRGLPDIGAYEFQMPHSRRIIQGVPLENRIETVPFY